MVSSFISDIHPLFLINFGTKSHFKNQFLFPTKSKIYCSKQQNPKNNIQDYRMRKTHFLDSVFISSDEQIPLRVDKPTKDEFFRKKNGNSQDKPKKDEFFREKNENSQVGTQEMLVLCGVSYYVNGFRGFPWLALNFHMAHNLNMNPSTLQLVQNFGNLPLVAKPLFGILSDAIYIRGAHRLPYISIGVVLQVLSWGSLALIPIATEARLLIACVIFGNIGASIAEVATDALVAEYGQKNKVPGLQSYALMASAIGGVLGNLLGGFFLMKTHQTKSMFLAFAAILAFQLTISLKTREESLGLPSYALMRRSIPQSIKKQYSDLMVEIKDESIFRPLVWIVSSVIAVPILSGSVFCYQTQCLNLDPSVIGMSKVMGQLMLLSLTLLYDRFGKAISMRKLAFIVQSSYAFTLLLDMVLVKQINLQLGIPNEVFALCFSGLAETIAQFKNLPFLVLFANLAPPGCEGSLMSFLASALCLSNIVGGFFGIGLASVLGITAGDYSSLPLGIVIQFVAALVPLIWIGNVPNTQTVVEKVRKTSGSKRTRRNRRVGRVLLDAAESSYRRKRESDLQR